MLRKISAASHTRSRAAVPLSGTDGRAKFRRSGSHRPIRCGAGARKSRIGLSAVPTRTHLFDGLETVLQGSNRDHEIVAAHIQHPEHRIIGTRTHLLSPNVSV